MNKVRFSSVPLALAMLSAHIASAHSRAGFDDINYTGLAKLTADGDTNEGGGDPAVDTSVVGTGASTDQAQQDQGANTAPQADGTDAVGTPPAGSDQQQAEGAAPQANAEPETAAGTDQVQ